MEWKWAYAALENRAFKLGSSFEFVEFCVLAFLSFSLPVLVGHPQQVVGTLVNAFLIITALNLGARQAFFLSLLPSIGALTRGVLFGPFTPALAIMVPFIWAGNFILILAIKMLLIERRASYALAVIAGSFAKASLLFASAFALLQFNLVPALFLTAMGAVQLFTALAGGVLAWLVVKAGSRLARLPQVL
ncbi:MAG: hypothetical protein AB1468_01055 [Candidatus Micrarchaeota archaeon]